MPTLPPGEGSSQLAPARGDHVLARTLGGLWSNLQLCQNCCNGTWWRRYSGTRKTNKEKDAMVHIREEFDKKHNPHMALQLLGLSTSPRAQSFLCVLGLEFQSSGWSGKCLFLMSHRTTSFVVLKKKKITNFYLIISTFCSLCSSFLL